MARPSFCSFCAAAALGALLFAGCFATTQDVKFLRPQLPALAEDCPVNVIASPEAPYPVEDLVELTLTYAPGGRDAAMNRLRERTCYYGGDTLYAVAEQARSNASTLVTAKIARRPAGEARPQAPSSVMPPMPTAPQASAPRPAAPAASARNPQPAPAPAPAPSPAPTTAPPGR